MNIWHSNGVGLEILQVDDDGNPTIDMELMEFNEIMRASSCSRASWIGGVNLLEAAAAAEYRGRRAVYCMYSRSWDGGWKDGIPGEVCCLLNTRSKNGRQIYNERWFVVFHAGNVFESRYIFKERCRDWTDDLKKLILPKTFCSILPNEYAWQFERCGNKHGSWTGAASLGDLQKSHMPAPFQPLPNVITLLQPCFDMPYEYAWPCRNCVKRRQKQLARHSLWLEKVKIVNSKLQVHSDPTVNMRSMAMSLLNLGPKKMHRRIANMITNHEEWERKREVEMQAQWAFQQKLEDLLLDKDMSVQQKLDALGLSGKQPASLEGFLTYKFKYGWKKKCTFSKFSCKQSKNYMQYTLAFF